MRTALLIAALFLAACEREAPATPKVTPAPAAAPAPAKSETPASAGSLTEGPLTYFQSHCSRCHGSYGGYYDAAMLASSGGPALRTKVDAMCRGPGGKALAGDDISAQVAFHESLRDKVPFVVVMTMDGQQVTGEASPGATVEAFADGVTVPAELTGHRWKATVPPDHAGWKIRATRGAAKVECEAKPGTFSRKDG